MYDRLYTGMSRTQTWRTDLRMLGGEEGEGGAVCEEVTWGACALPYVN